jgi:subtilisin family serine protease
MNDIEKSKSCINLVTENEPFLTGEGVIIAVIDSGIDYFLPEFIDENGETRIIAIWDQSLTPGNGMSPPKGYSEGVLYTRKMINEALKLGRREGMAKVPVTDTSGHGTAVAGVAAGTYMGVAPKAEILVVKLGKSLNDSFPKTTQLMRGIDYAIRTGVSLNKPVSINISFGNTYGDHRGNSLLEQFIDNVSQVGRTSIIVGSGNEGVSAGHTSGTAFDNRSVEFAVAEYETGLNIQIWKFYQDIFNITLISPSGEKFKIQYEDINNAKSVRARLEQTEILCYIGKPQPYNVQQEIFIDMIPDLDYIDSGIWRFEIEPVSVVTGEYRIYMPGYAARNLETGFLLPTPDMTMTIPSTSRKVISVGAYDAANGAYADFSGRGYVYRYDDKIRNMIGEVKPDIVAPGVDITVPLPYGGYEEVSGTSFATPFVSGACALLMEWGIIRGNDSFLYGEKLKALLIQSAKKPLGADKLPDSKFGWGTLCVFVDNLRKLL